MRTSSDSFRVKVGSSANVQSEYMTRSKVITEFNKYLDMKDFHYYRKRSHHCKYSQLTKILTAADVSKDRIPVLKHTGSGSRNVGGFVV